MRKFLLCFLLVAGCAGDTGAAAATQSDPAIGAVDSVVVGLDVRVAAEAGSALESYDGFAIAASQIRSVRLRVDDTTWGVYSVPATTPPTNAIDVNGWSLVDARSPAAVVAMLGSASESEMPDPVTVGDWVSALEQRLFTGGHLVEVEEVTLANESGEQIVLSPRTVLPIRVENGDRTSAVSVALEVAELGGGA